MFMFLVYLLGSGACSLATGAPYVESGERFDRDHFTSLKPGISRAEVISILGAPQAETTSKERLDLTYFFTERKDEITYYLGLFPSRDALSVTTWEGVARFRNGRLESSSILEYEGRYRQDSGHGP